MSDVATVSALTRIDQALDRIQAALAAREETTRALAERHEALRARAAEAVTALDALIARTNG